MKKVFSVLLLLLVIVSCDSKVDWSQINGNPNDVLGKELYDKLIDKYEFIGNYEEGTIIVKTKKYGLLDFEGNEILPCLYDTIYGTKNNIRFIRKDKLYGIIGKEGEKISECKYDTCLYPTRNFIPVMLHKKWGFVNIKGENIISLKYDLIYEYNDSTFTASYNGKLGISDYKDNILLKYIYDDITNYDEDGYIATLKGKVLIINKNYQQVTKPIFEAGFLSSYIYNGYASLTIPETHKRGLVEIETGKITIPFVYDNIGEYSDGLVWVCNNDKYGYVNLKNEIVIPLIYDDAKNFSEGLAEVGKIYKLHHGPFGYVHAKHYGFINKKGDTIIPFIFEDQTLSSGSGFHSGLASMGTKQAHNIYAGKEGYINKKGEFVIKPIYDSAKDFTKGAAIVVQNDRYGAINTKGQIIIPIKYEDGYIRESTSEIEMREGENYYYYSLNGKFLRTE